MQFRKYIIRFRAMFFWKTSYELRYRRRSFRSENFNYEKPFLFELRAVELAILFYLFLNRSPWLKADENNTKVQISNTNFNNKVPNTESSYKNVILSQSLKLLRPLTLIFFLNFKQNLSKVFFISWYFSTSRIWGTWIF